MFLQNTICLEKCEIKEYFILKLYQLIEQCGRAFPNTSTFKNAANIKYLKNRYFVKLQDRYSSSRLLRK